MPCLEKRKQEKTAATTGVDAASGWQLTGWSLAVAVSQLFGSALLRGLAAEVALADVLDAVTHLLELVVVERHDAGADDEREESYEREEEEGRLAPHETPP